MCLFGTTESTFFNRQEWNNPTMYVDTWKEKLHGPTSGIHIYMKEKWIQTAPLLIKINWRSKKKLCHQNSGQEDNCNLLVLIWGKKGVQILYLKRIHIQKVQNAIHSCLCSSLKKRGARNLTKGFPDPTTSKEIKAQPALKDFVVYIKKNKPNFISCKRM
jgi:hypothetical protein